MVSPFVFLNQDRNTIFQHNFAFVNDQRREGNELLGDNKIQYAFTNYNGIEVRDRGLLVDQDMFVRESAVTSNPDGRDTLVITFYNVCAITGTGQFLPMDAQYDTLFLSNLAIDPDLISDVEDVEQVELTLYPNPANEVVHLQMDKPITGAVRIIDLQGRVMDQVELSSDRLTIPTDEYAAGLYFLQVTGESGETVTRSFVKESSR